MPRRPRSLGLHDLQTVVATATRSRLTSPHSTPNDHNHPRSTCATLLCMSTVGLRELRQHASELIRRVEAGEEVTITVAGRPSARLVSIAPQTWQTYAEVADLFSGQPDPDWETDRDQIDQQLRDPWNAP